MVSLGMNERGWAQVPGPVNRPEYFPPLLPGRYCFDKFQKYHLKTPGPAKKSLSDTCAGGCPDGPVAACHDPRGPPTVKIWSWVT